MAPGISVAYTLTFTPNIKDDYFCDLVCVTEREKFLIPVRALGDTAKVDFPTKLTFSDVPVNYPSTKTFYLRNIGPIPTTFAFDAAAPFSVNPQLGKLNVNTGQSITVTFNPEDEEYYEDALYLTLNDKETQEINLSGNGRSVEVYLDTPELEVPMTYMNLTSHRSVRLYNKSNVPVQFHWKTRRTNAEERRLKAETLMNLDVAEQAEIESLEDTILEVSDDDVSSDDDGEGRGGYHRLKAVKQINRKYNRLRRNLEEESMSYIHENFVVEPLMGEIYPNGSMEVSVTFTPHAAEEYLSTAFCEVAGSMNRLPLQLFGKGAGPQAVFSYDTLDIGEVYIKAVHHYEIVLQNVGDIEAHYQLVESNDRSRFSFSPDRGTLGVSPENLARVKGVDDEEKNDSFDMEIVQPTSSSSALSMSSRITKHNDKTTIAIDFSSDNIGEFVEVMEWNLQGSKEPLRITFKGKVIGPTFYFEEKGLDFGTVSFGFLSSKNLSLHNTSEIPMKYKVRVPEDGKFMQREFGLVPSQGTILPRNKGVIKVDFIPEMVQSYKDYNLVIDVDGVGEALVSLPIQATCEVATVDVASDTLDFGEIFLRHTYEHAIDLKNHSDLYARFEMQTQDEHSQTVAVVEAAQQGASIPPQSSHQLRVNLTPQRLGNMVLPIFFKVPGSGDVPLVITATGTVVGPKVKTDKSLLNFGSVFVLTPVEKTLVVTNNSPIPADFKCFVHKKNSVFTVHTTSGRLKPFETTEIKLTAYVDETAMMNDKLYIVVEEGDNIIIPLRARGVGTTVTSAQSTHVVTDRGLEQKMEEVKVVDHGFVFTKSVTEKTFRFTNNGRRPQVLQWEYIEPPEVDEEEAKYASKNKNIRKRGMAQNDDDGEVFGAIKGMPRKGAGMVSRKRKKPVAKKPGLPGQQEEEPLVTIFKITPEKVHLEPGHAIDFTVKGLSEGKGIMTEKWVCKSMVGSEKKMQDIYLIQVRANFITPRLSLSQESISFQYMMDPTDPLEPQLEPLYIKNVCELPLVFSTRCPYPFTSDRLEFELQPGEEVMSNVSFVADPKGDRMSTKMKCSMAITYRDHPQRDKLPLFGEICFPNLSFEAESIAFGCVLNDTTKRVVKKVTNHSKIPASYEWVFYEADDGKHHGGRGKRYAVNEVFDIAPIRGVLEPGQSEDVEFTFYGHADYKMKGVAVCEVVGGPSYEINLEGRASSVAFSIDRTEIDFGPKDLNVVEDSELCIYNTGKVGFNYKIDASTVVRPILAISPMSGRINAGEKQKIGVRLYSLLPDEIDETFTISVAYFDPVPIKVTSMGVFPMIALSLPRQSDQLFNKTIPRATVSLEDKAVRDELKAKLELENALSLGLNAKAGVKDTSVSFGVSKKIPNMSRANSSMSLFNTSRNTSRAAMSSTGKFTGRPGSSSLGGTNQTSDDPYAPVPIDPQLLRANPKLPVHLECDRLIYLDVVLQEVLARQAAKEAKHMAESKSLGDSGMGVSKRLATPKTRISSKNEAEVPSFCVSKYSCNFGHVIQGTTRKKSFKLTNVGGVSLSFEIPKRLLMGSVFAIEPLQVIRLPPGTSMDFVVTCYSDRNRRGRKDKEKKGGVLENTLASLIIPISIRNGPEVRLRLKANICYPEVVVSQTKLDFGAVFIGQQKQITIQLHNPKEVPCDWNFKAMIGASPADTHSFECEPDSGTLTPGARQNVVVKYAPREVRRVSVKMPIRVFLNPFTQLIVARGFAKSVVVNFSPGLVRMGPVLPYTRSGCVEVEMENKADCAIEVYSLDFDQQYLEEEEILRQEDDYVDGVMLCPPRQPGEGLPVEILANYRVRQKALAKEHGASVVSNSLVDLSALDDEEGEAPVRNILVIGAPFSGRSTISAGLAARLGLGEVVVSINEIIKHVYALYCQVLLSAQAEESKNKSSRTSTAAATAPSMDASADAEETTEKEGQLTEGDKQALIEIIQRIESKREQIVEMAEEKADAQAERSGANRKGRTSRAKIERKGRRSGNSKNAPVPPVSPSPPPAVGATPARPVTLMSVAAINSKLVSEDAVDTTLWSSFDYGVLDEALVEQAVSLFLHHPPSDAFHQGIVIDGLHNAFLSQWSTAAVLKTVFENISIARDNSLHIVTLDVSQMESEVRHNMMVEDCSATIAEELPPAAKRFKVLGAKDFNKLNDKKRVEYQETRALVQAHQDAVAKLAWLNGAAKKELQEYFDYVNGVERSPSPVSTSDTKIADVADVSEESVPVVVDASATAVEPVAVTVNPLIGIDSTQTAVAVSADDSQTRADSAKEADYDHGDQPREPLTRTLNIFGIQNSYLNESSIEPVDGGVSASGAVDDSDDIGQPIGTGDTSHAVSSDTDGGAVDPTGEDPDISLDDSTITAEQARELAKYDQQDVELSTEQKWVKGKRFAAMCPQTMLVDRVLAWINEVFYAEIDPAELDPSWVPAPRTLQVIYRPRARAARQNITKFFMVDRSKVEENPVSATLIEEVAEEEKGGDKRKGSKTRAKRGGKDKDKKKDKGKDKITSASVVTDDNRPVSSDSVTLEGELGAQPLAYDEFGNPIEELESETVDDGAGVLFAKETRSRWVIPPRSKQVISLQFCSSTVGRVQRTMGFEVQGHNPGQVHILNCHGVCAVPEIAEDPRSVFMRRMKRNRPNAIIHKQYIASEKTFDFGPLLLGKDPTSRVAPGLPQPVRAVPVADVVPAVALDGAHVDDGGSKSGRKSDRKNKQSSPTSVNTTASPVRPSSSTDADADASNVSPSPSLSASEVNGVTFQPISTVGLDRRAILKLLSPQQKDAYKEARAFQKGVRKTNGQTFRITNSGLFPAHIDFALQASITSAGVEEKQEDRTDSRPISAGKSKLGAGGRKSRKELMKKKEDQKKAKDKAKKGGASGRKSGADDERAEPVDLVNQPVFLVEPAFLDLEIDETREITVWSFPQATGVYEDTLVCSVKDNPVPVVFPLRCEGVKPVLELSTNEVVFHRLQSGRTDFQTIEITNPCNIPAMWAFTGLDELAEEFVITPATQGVVDPQGKQFITITYNAQDQKVLEHTLSLDIYDNENQLLGKADSRELKLQAESFTIDAKIDFPDSGILDFGVVRVNDTVVQEFNITNEGKYDIKYHFVTADRSKMLFNDIFVVSPDEGHLQPGEAAKISITAKTNREHILHRDASLRLIILEGESNRQFQSIPCVISLRSVFSKYRVLPAHSINFGPLEQGVETSKKIRILNDGEFDFEYRLFPADPDHEFSRANTVALETASTAKADSGDTLEEPEGVSSGRRSAGRSRSSVKAGRKSERKSRAAKDAKGKKAGKGKDKSKDKSYVQEFKIGAFTVSPTGGIIPKGGYIEVEVGIDSSSCASYVEGIEIDIAQRDMANDAIMEYELSGEICSPGIDTRTWDTIFEEQEVRPRIENALSKNYFARDDRTFMFSPVIANNRNVLGLTERFKIVNPFKVPCNVQMRTVLGSGMGGQAPAASNQNQSSNKSSKKSKQNKDNGMSSNTGVTDSSNPFQVLPTALHIPAHEHRYVTVSFTPKSLQAYKGVFEALVDKGTDSNSSLLSFDLRGEGTLPHLTVDQPHTLDEENGCIRMDFPRVFCDQSRSRSFTRQIVVRNEGIVPATARFDTDNTDVFRFSGLGQMVTVDAGQTTTFDVAFHPPAPGMHKAELKMVILRNPFEVTTFALSGIGYTEDVTAEGDDLVAPVSTTRIVKNSLGESVEIKLSDTDQEVVFGDVACGETISKTFDLVNYSNTPYRFDWQPFVPFSVENVSDKSKKKKKNVSSSLNPAASGEEGQNAEPGFSFSPSLGHIQPHSSKQITLTFKSNKALSHVLAPCKCVLSSIKYLSRAEIQLRAEQAATASAALSKKGGKKGGKGQSEEAERADADIILLPSTAGFQDDDQEIDLANMDWDDTFKIARFITRAELRAMREAELKSVAAEEAAAAKSKNRRNTSKAPKSVVSDASKTVFSSFSIPADVDLESGDGNEMLEVMQVMAEPAHQEMTPQVEEEKSVSNSRKSRSSTSFSGSVQNDERSSLKQGPTREVTLRLSVTADKSKYECKVNRANFRPTMMFQTRVFKFPVMNTASTVLKYNWNLQLDEYVKPRVPRERDSLLALDSEEEEEEEEEQPFSISPQSGEILPGEFETFHVNFSPVDARRYGCLLKALIPHLADDMSPLEIRLNGSSLRPTCHFELVSSDYLTAHRRKVGLPGPNGVIGPLDESFKVIEFKSLGLKVRNTRRFYVVNPTNQNYTFNWEMESEGNLAGSKNPFRCLTRHGQVQSGRKFEIVFDYTPEVDQLVETFWRFTIPDHNISIPILLVGSVSEPDIKLDTSHINFNAVLVGRRDKRTAYLINNELLPFNFTIDRSVFQASNSFGDAKPILDIVPSSGVVRPEEKLPLKILFRPSEEKKFNFNVKFIIRKKPGRVALNVKGEGYAIRSAIRLEDEMSNSVYDLMPGVNNRIDFGQVHIYEKRSKQLLISNTGKFMFDFVWNVPQNQYVSISPVKANVAPGENMVCNLIFHTRKEISVDNIKLTCTVANSLKYQCVVSGRGKKPSISFSDTQLNYGLTFINEKQGGIPCDPVTYDLVIANHERTENVAVEVMDPQRPYLEVGSANAVLTPGEKLVVPITFHPTEVRKYRDVIPFEINGLYQVRVVVSGEGTPLKLHLLDAGQSTINFGNSRINSATSRAVTLINNSRKAATFCFRKDVARGFSASRPRSSSSAAQKLDQSLSCYPLPGELVTLRPRETFDAEFKYTPDQRMSAWSRQISLHAHGTRKKLLTVTGSSIGIGVRLDSNKLSFGNVITNSSRTHKVKLSNFGDIGVQFDWRRTYQPHFQIIPASGYVPAHDSITFDVVFAPKIISHDILVTTTCLIDGIVTEGMDLMLLGACVDEPYAEAQQLDFKTKVRQKVRQSIVLDNPTTNAWSLQPQIRNSYWSGVASIDVPAQSKVNYTLTYHPLSMTAAQVEEGTEARESKNSKGSTSNRGKGRRNNRESEEAKAAEAEAAAQAAALALAEARKNAIDPKSLATPRASTVGDERDQYHQGSIFFPLPTGKAVMYKLSGIALPAEAESTIRKEVVAKKKCITELIVKNWLKEYQRFKVIIDAKDADSSVILKGNSTLDVPGTMERKYKLSYYSYKEGTTNATVTFLNEVTGESIFFDLVFTSSRMEVLATIPPLNTTVRKSLLHEFTISNPLNEDAVFTSFECKDPSIFVPLPITVPAQSEQVVELYFRPLVASKGQNKPILKLKTNILGDFLYQLTLNAEKVTSSKILRFNTYLGHDIVQTFRFTSFCDKATEYECFIDAKASDTCFTPLSTKVHAEASLPGSEGARCQVDVRFEPSRLGSSRAVLRLVSPQGGEYSCVLTGVCETPKPQGPYLVVNGSSISIKFKNVLESSENFQFSVDNAAFIVTKKSEKINKKGQTDIKLQFKPSADQIKLMEQARAAQGSRGADGVNGGRSSSSGAMRSRQNEQLIARAAKVSLGKLLIASPVLKNVTWVYYLQGTLDK